MSPKRKQNKPKETHYCRECKHMSIVTTFHTLSLEGKPTLGRCPYMQRSVLLSEKVCENFIDVKTKDS